MRIVGRDGGAAELRLEGGQAARAQLRAEARLDAEVVGELREHLHAIPGRLVVDAEDAGEAAGAEPLGDRLVGGDHEALDQAVRLVLAARLDAGGLARRGVEGDVRLVPPEIDAAARRAHRGEPRRRGAEPAHAWGPRRQGRRCEAPAAKSSATAS